MKINLQKLEEYISENQNGKKSPVPEKIGLFGWHKPSLGSGASPLQNPFFKGLEKTLSSNQNHDDFVSRLFYYINLKDKKNSEVYNAAGMTPDCFSKIISGKTKTPKKENIVALAIALNLNIEEATDLLGSAGFSLYKEKSDLIYRFCFENGPYTIDEVNEALVYFGCKAIGGR